MVAHGLPNVAHGLTMVAHGLPNVAHGLTMVAHGLPNVAHGRPYGRARLDYGRARTPSPLTM
ncbi:hypothetical protein M405DRAFT_861803 [Rhizopogon salebrosus TDB-379]|nr:hypothetical protein M405DRAFT_861803 [Rhizopogon salebrosus TDB-379]